MVRRNNPSGPRREEDFSPPETGRNQEKSPNQEMKERTP